MKPTRVLFVCHGNICRSPMAEFIFKDMVRSAYREYEFEIASAATSREEIGSDLYPPAKRILSAHSIPYERRRARQLTREDMDAYDLVIAMDRANLWSLRRMFGEEAIARKGRLLTPDREIEDPWYTDDFETAYRDIEAGCRALLAELTESTK